MFSNLKSAIKDFVSLRILKRRSNLSHVCKHLSSLGFSPSSIIDIGVASGTPGLYQHFPHSSLVLVEPLIEFEPKIKSLLRKSGDRYYIAAASDIDSTANINVHLNHLEGTSLLVEEMGSDYDGCLRNVPSIRIDNLVTSLQLSGPILLKIDVQGGELTVLNGCSGILDLIECIILEVSFFRFMKGSSVVSEVIDYLSSLGFEPYDLIHGWYRPLDNSLGQVDIVFVKRDSFLRSDHRYATSNQYFDIHPSVSSS